MIKRTAGNENDGYTDRVGSAEIRRYENWAFETGER